MSATSDAEETALDWMLFGKTPREADFVRVNLRTALGVECFGWLADAVSQIGPAASALAPQGTRFALTFPSRPHLALVGVMVPSRDRVGRDFPLVACREVSLAHAARHWSTLPLAWSDALGRVRRVLAMSDMHDAPELARQLADIDAPSGAEVREVDELAMGEMRTDLAAEFEQRLFREGAAAYAYVTVRVACAMTPRPSAPALLCPITQATDVTAWLELVRRTCGNRGATPSWLWSIGEEPRLAICLGYPHLSLVSAFVGLPGDPNRLWPLSTSSEPALARARDEMRGIEASQLASVNALLSAVARLR